MAKSKKAGTGVSKPKAGARNKNGGNRYFSDNKALKKCDDLDRLNHTKFLGIFNHSDPNPFNVLKNQNYGRKKKPAKMNVLPLKKDRAAKNQASHYYHSRIADGGKSDHCATEKKCKKKKKLRKDITVTVQKNDESMRTVHNIPSNITPKTNSSCDDRLNWLLHPTIERQEFFSYFWETKPFLIQRKSPDYYSGLSLSSMVIDEILANNSMYFTKHVDVTTYVNGVRETHNPDGRALPHVVWDFYKNGCSIRLLNPQAFIPSVHCLNSELQDKLGFVGSNIYLTPPNSQGFAPHWDDIEAFVLQIEGAKHWSVYPPLKEDEKLPRYSSKNLEDKDIGSPCLECVLEPGDMLYFPRGFIHQAKATDKHSLHITLSAYQCTSFVDLLETLVPAAVKEAAKTHVGLRQGLPLNYGQSFGLTRSVSSHNVKDRTRMVYKIKEIMHSVVDNLDIDSAVDEFAARKLHDQLPPWLSDDVKNCSVYNNRTKMETVGKISGVVQLQINSKVCLLSLNVCRLVKEDGKYNLYHSINNSLEYHERERESLEMPEGSIRALQILFETYPQYITVNDLPFSDDEEKWSFANSLWELGILRTKTPLKEVVVEPSDEDESDNEDKMEGCVEGK